MAARPRRSTAGTTTRNASARPASVRLLTHQGASRDDAIDQTFDDAGWIFHLRLKGTHGQYDKASVAIELANDLALDLDLRLPALLPRRDHRVSLELPRGHDELFLIARGGGRWCRETARSCPAAAA